VEARNLSIPKNIVAGDTVSWNETIDGYPSGEYTAKFLFIPYRANAGANVFSVSGTQGAGANEHLFAISNTSSAGIIPGLYKGSLSISQSGFRTTVVTDIELAILPNPETITAYPKTQAEITLDNVNTAIEKVLKTGVATLTVNGRTIEYTSPKDLFELKKFYEDEVKTEKEKISGRRNPTIYCRF